MIRKLKLSGLRNAEHMQFITDACVIFDRHGNAIGELTAFRDELSILRQEEETAMAVERSNAKIKEKNEADRTRDRLHSALFNYLKSILYDDTDPRYTSAQRLMQVMKETGNPNQLAENAQSAMLTTLGNKFDACPAEVADTGAQTHIDKLMSANRLFMQLESECRDINTARSQSPVRSVGAIRKQIDPVYRKMVDAINVLITLNGEAPYTGMVADLNTLVSKYDALLNQRK